MNNKASKILYYVLMTLLAALFMFPLVWMISSSLKPEAAIYNDLVISANGSFPTKKYSGDLILSAT